MKHVEIKMMRLSNFKGIKSLQFEFSKETNIEGANGSGKTSLFDALLWLLFGRDSEGKTDFQIKTLDANGKPIHNIDHEVEVLFSVGGEDMLLRKCYREKWTKKRNSNIPELTGHENNFFWNEVPLKEVEFKTKVAEIMDEKLFKLLTNPLYFNTLIKWDERRRVLLDMADPISDETIIGLIETQGEGTEWLRTRLAKKATVENMRDELRHKSKAVKDELDLIPVRIDEAYKSIPPDQDFAPLRNEIAINQAEIAKLEASKENALKAQNEANKAVMDKQAEKNNLERELQAKRHALKSEWEAKIAKIDSEVRIIDGAIKNAIAENQNAITRQQQARTNIANEEAQLSQFRKEWAEVNAWTFEIKPGATSCPSCQREFEGEKLDGMVADMRAKFDKQKADRLASIQQQAQGKKELIARIQASIENVPNYDITADTEKLTALNNEREALMAFPPTDTQEIYDLVARINAIVIPEIGNVSFAEINAKIDGYRMAIREAEKKLAQEGIREQVEKRVDELSERESVLNQELADIEARLWAVEQYNKIRIEALVKSVNARFTYTRFKLFEEQLNGGLNEVCEALINTNGSWVPFDSANNAGRINAGIDIINALGNFYGTTAPIFIDNREGVTELIYTNSQVINLRVKEKTPLSLISK